MSAANSLDQSLAPGVEQRAYEPTMEEILASIRRIIADDQSMLGQGASPEPSAVRPAAAPEQVGLRGFVEAASVPEPVAPEPMARHPLQPDPRSSSEPVPPVREPAWDVVPAAVAPDAPAQAHESAPQYALSDGPFRVPEPELPEPELQGAHHAEPVRSDEHELYDEPLGHVHDTPELPRTVALADTLFSTATDASVAAAFKTLAASRIADNSDELLDLAREMIRPLLKTWIDNNLPTMVERLVRAEIERVARGGH